MTLNELKRKYAHLRDEIDQLGSANHNSEARRAQLMYELDLIDKEYAAVKRRSLTAPTLSDVVFLAEPLHFRQNQRAVLQSPRYRRMA